MDDLVESVVDAGDEITVRYVSLGMLRQYYLVNNPKLHSIESIVRAFQIHGFRDPIEFDPNLNAGEGGVVAGNGRLEALATMFDRGDPIPRGIKPVENDWLVPLQLGVAAGSEAAAMAYALDSNNLGLVGAGFTTTEIAKLWDEDGYVDILKALSEQDVLPVSVDSHKEIRKVIGAAKARETREAGNDYELFTDEEKIEPVVNLTIIPLAVPWSLSKRWAAWKESRGFRSDADAFALALDLLEDQE